MINVIIEILVKLLHLLTIDWYFWKWQEKIYKYLTIGFYCIFSGSSIADTIFFRYFSLPAWWEGTWGCYTDTYVYLRCRKSAHGEMKTEHAQPRPLIKNMMWVCLYFVDGFIL